MERGVSNGGIEIGSIEDVLDEVRRQLIGTENGEAAQHRGSGIVRYLDQRRDVHTASERFLQVTNKSQTNLVDRGIFWCVVDESLDDRLDDGATDQATRTEETERGAGRDGELRKLVNKRLVQVQRRLSAVKTRANRYLLSESA